MAPPVSLKEQGTTALLTLCTRVRAPEAARFRALQLFTDRHCVSLPAVEQEGMDNLIWQSFQCCLLPPLASSLH